MVDDSSRLDGLEGFVVKVFLMNPNPKYVESVFVVAESEKKAIDKTRESYTDAPHEFSTSRTRQLQPGVYVLGNLQPMYLPRQ
jgi:hypothetical protein